MQGAEPTEPKRQIGQVKAKQIVYENLSKQKYIYIET